METNMTRKERLMPNGIPRYIRCYDNEEFIDRYTVVFSNKRVSGEFMYLGMSSRPFHPQGIGQHGFSKDQIDAPKGWPPVVGRKCHLGTRIRFEDLPVDCRDFVLQDYLELWGIE